MSIGQWRNRNELRGASVRRGGDDGGQLGAAAAMY
jgi:hypothetical protein